MDCFATLAMTDMGTCNDMTAGCPEKNKVDIFFYV